MATVERRHGVITDEGIRALRSRIGVPARQRDLPFFQDATEDNIRNFAHGIGDTNPLFTDPDYAATTRWGGSIAPGCMLFSMGISEGREISPQEREEGRGGGLPGVHSMWSGVEFEWFVPIRAGDTIYQLSYLAEAQEKQGRFAGREVLSRREAYYRNQRNEVVGRQVSLEMHTERDTAREAGKYKLEPYQWSDAEIDAIEAAYEGEQPRGAQPRYWEDVRIGEALAPPLVRGPFTGTDAIAWKMGWGFAPFVRSGKDAYLYRKRHPRAYVRNSLNIPDVVERVHWESEFAHEAGLPGYYDYGPQRASWMGNFLTNWIGDDGWLKAMSMEARRFNVEGDAQWYRGRVTGKQVEDLEYRVDIEVWAENQRGETTAPGKAVVLLPSREGGPVRFPTQGQAVYPTWDGATGKVIPSAAGRR